MVIEKLLGKRGDAENLLHEQRENDGFLDLSDDNWDRAQVVLQGLSFTKAKLENKDVRANFVSCAFHQSLFNRITSDAHYWAAENQCVTNFFGIVCAKRSLVPLAGCESLPGKE